MEVNGIAHIQLTVTNVRESTKFYEPFLHFLEMKTLIKGDGIVYCIGSRTGILVRGAPAEKRDQRFDQDRPGLHHMCFRARAREDIDVIHRFLVDELDAHVVHAPEESPQFAPGYYSVLFEDPDGIRVEVDTWTYVCSFCSHCEVGTPEDWNEDIRAQTRCHNCGTDLGSAYQCPECRFPRGWMDVNCPYCGNLQPVYAPHWVAHCDYFRLECVRCESLFMSACIC